MGSILFMTLEGEEDMGKTVETAVAASKPRTDLVNADIRSRWIAFRYCDAQSSFHIFIRMDYFCLPPSTDVVGCDQ